MKKPDQRYEHELMLHGRRAIAGVDEVGRGALAGPIVAAAVVLPPHCDCTGIRDSKTLTKKARDSAARHIMLMARAWHVAFISPHIIDIRGISEANDIALITAAELLDAEPDYVICDGNRSVPFSVAHESIVDADARIVSVAAASILAKVARDRYMIALHEQYPMYGFSSHVGYGSAFHLKALDQFGPSAVHRMTFHPCRAAGHRKKSG